MWQGIVHNVAHALSHPDLIASTQGMLPKRGIAGYADGGDVAPPAPISPLAQQDPRIGVIADAEDALGHAEDGGDLQPDHLHALQTFQNMFGPSALQHLHANVKQGMSMRPRKGRLVLGEGGGKDDKVPARVDKVKEAKLSSGEFVMPTDAVAGAGQGDPILGAQRLQQLSEHLTSMKQAKAAKAATAMAPMKQMAPMQQMQPTRSMQPPLNVEQVG